MSDEQPESDRVGAAPHPRNTLNLFGQLEAEQNFLSSFGSGRLHHAWLLTGPRGVGKATLAWRIARFLLFAARARRHAPDDHSTATTLEVPNSAPVVRSISLLVDPSVKLLRRQYDSKSKRFKKDISVTDVRSINAFMSMSSTDGDPRLAIIDSADDLNVNAANALLKILEEPPENAYFFLISNVPSRLLPTVRSRCRNLSCSPLSGDHLEQALRSSGIEQFDQVPYLRELASGSVGEALRLQNDDGPKLYGSIVDLLGDAPHINKSRAAEIAIDCEGAKSEARYDATTRLLSFLVGRLAKFGATRSAPAPAAEGEIDMLKRLASNHSAGCRWADLYCELTKSAADAKSVTLDPFAVVMGMLNGIERVAEEVRS